MMFGKIVKTNTNDVMYGASEKEYKNLQHNNWVNAEGFLSGHFLNKFFDGPESEALHIHEQAAIYRQLAFMPGRFYLHPVVKRKSNVLVEKQAKWPYFYLMGPARLVDQETIWGTTLTAPSGALVVTSIPPQHQTEFLNQFTKLKELRLAGWPASMFTLRKWTLNSRGKPHEIIHHA